MRRTAGIVVGILTQALFLTTVWQLFWFLKGDRPAAADRGGLGFDCALALQFAIPHSVLLVPGVRKTIKRWVSEAFDGLFYCLAACVSLGMIFRFWHTSDVVLWRLASPGKTCVEAAFVGSWIALFYSLKLTGLGYQSGWTPWWHWLRRRSLPRRTFEPRGAYRILRHPVYLSFLGLLWFTPTMSLDRAILTGIWTVYIFMGSYLKDRRLVCYLGETYRSYQARVPGYPGMFLGPLARNAYRAGEQLPRIAARKPRSARTVA